MSTVTHWNPFKGMARIEPTWDEFFRGFGVRPRGMDLEPDFRMDVAEDEKSFTVKAEIPGVKKDDIHITVDGNQVSVSAEVKRETTKKDEKERLTERYYGKVYRSFSLPNDVDSAKTSAKYESGILTLTLPKKANGGTKRISVG